MSFVVLVVVCCLLCSLLFVGCCVLLIGADRSALFVVRCVAYVAVFAAGLSLCVVCWQMLVAVWCCWLIDVVC